MTVLQKFYLIFVPERHFCGVSVWARHFLFSTRFSRRIIIKNVYVAISRVFLVVVACPPVIPYYYFFDCGENL
jgi:hypothetical protein